MALSFVMAAAKLAPHKCMGQFFHFSTVYREKPIQAVKLQQSIKYTIFNTSPLKSPFVKSLAYVINYYCTFTLQRDNQDIIPFKTSIPKCMSRLDKPVMLSHCRHLTHIRNVCKPSSNSAKTIVFSITTQDCRKCQ